MTPGASSYSPSLLSEERNVRKGVEADEGQRVKFVDLRFTDTRGKEQHVTVPASTIDAGFFKDGKMFDGSSIAGWKGINESDMVLMPDTDTAVMDPFTDEPTLNLRCDILEPNTMKGYERDPRSHRQARRSLSEVHQDCRHRLLRAGKRIFHFR